MPPETRTLAKRSSRWIFVRGDVAFDVRLDQHFGDVCAPVVLLADEQRGVWVALE